MSVSGVAYGNSTFTTPADGIALDPEAEHVYYCALQGLSLYRVPAALLRARPFDRDAVAEAVETVRLHVRYCAGVALASLSWST